MNQADVIREIKSKVPSFQPDAEDVRDELTYMVMGDLGRHICSHEQQGVSEEVRHGLDCLEFLLGTDYPDAINLVLDCLEGLRDCPVHKEIQSKLPLGLRTLWTAYIPG